MDSFKRNIIITGGAGFIGNHVIRRFVNNYPDYHVINVDKLTYAGNLANLSDLENNLNYTFIKLDICDFELLLDVFKTYNVDGVIHLAAESHVDRSIKDPFTFAKTNVMGTLSLLQAAKACWEGEWEGKRFYHISTDEVYGALPFDGTMFSEKTKYDPHSPYSASKASSDHFVRAFHDTFGMPTIISNCSNNYGPYQFPEKLIPLFIHNICHGNPLPIYGKGENVRDWLYVEDHCIAIDLIIRKGTPGEVYNIGGHNEKTNLEVVKTVLAQLHKSEDLITYVTDRPGHDRRYAIDPTKIHNELGWLPATPFDEGIKKTIAWYLDNREWWENIISGEYANYYDKMYGNR